MTACRGTYREASVFVGGYNSFGMKFNLFTAIYAVALVATSERARGQLSATQPSTQPSAEIVPEGTNPLVFPGAIYQGTPAVRIAAPAGCKLLHLTTARGDDVVALFGPAIDSVGQAELDFRRRPTFIYFYGNGESIAFSLRVFDLFRRMGVNVLNPDYVGYGMSGGKPSEAALYATADACYDYLTKEYGVAPRTIIAVGWSLGGGVATDLASRREVGGLAIFNAFTNLTDMAHHMLPWLPAAAKATYRFDNLAKVPSVHVPIFICNGVRDTFVPPEMSDRLAGAAGGTVMRVGVASADHNIFVGDVSGVIGPLRRFVAGLAAKP